MRATPRYALPSLLAALLLAGLGMPTLGAEGPGPALVVGGDVAAGDYVALRVDLPSPAFWELSIGYDATSDEPTLPLVALVTRVGATEPSHVTFFPTQGLREGGGSLGAEVAAGGTAVGTEPLAYHYGVNMNALFTPLPVGTYDVVLLSAPARGNAHLVVVFFADDASLLAVEQGRGRWVQGVEESDTRTEVRVLPGRTSDAAAAWAHLPVAVPTPVQGRLFGYAVPNAVLGGGWEDPAGAVRVGAIANGAAGAWTARFPADVWAEGCVAVGCEQRPQAAYVLGADVRFP